MQTRTIRSRIPFVAVLPFALMALLFTVAAAHAGSKNGASKDIVETAAEAGQFSTLITALKRAGLVETLKGEGPFTVFAPTDEAFARLPQDQLNALLADKERLTRVLTYHVVAGKVTSAEVAMLETADTVEGQALQIESSGGVRVNNAQVVKADIMASNGVIHVIDSVMMPE